MSEVPLIEGDPGLSSVPSVRRVSNTKPRMSRSSPHKSQRPTYLNPVFYHQTGADDDAVLSQQLFKLARRTGVLNLSGRGLAQVPNKVFDVNEPDDPADISIEQLTVNEDEAWWNQVPLTSLDLSSNALVLISPKIENLLSLTTLILHDNALVTLPPEIGKLEKLTRINLSHNKLQILPRELFTLPELRHLNIAYNQFEELNPDISDLHMLEYLDAGHNDLKSLPCGIGFLTRLIALLLPFNHIRQLPPDLVNMRSLQKLDLMQNDLKELPEDFGMLRKLQCLYVHHNDIEKLPTFEGNEELRELHASNNFIEVIPKSFCANLPHLKILDLRDNKIIILPEEICLLRNLTRLDVSNNSITILPLTLSSLAHLISLQVDGNPIKTIRRDIIQCGTSRILRTLLERSQARQRDTMNSTVEEDSSPTQSGTAANMFQNARLQGGQATTTTFPDRYKLRHTRVLAVNMEELTDVPENVFQVACNENVNIVDFSRNHLQALPQGLQHMAHYATELVFANNQIKVIQPFISQFTRISLINLACNNLVQLPNEFGVLNTLRELNISNNRFEYLPSCIYELSGLEILFANDNHIKSINASEVGLGKMKRLSTLDLRNNDIEQVPAILGNLTNITALELIGNPFRQPRHQILTKGTEAIMSYLRDRIPM